jgi:flagellar M-ring protein FliF
MVEVINSLNPTRKISLGVLLFVVVGLFVAGAIWLFMPKYDPLFRELDDTSAAQAITSLEEKGIPFTVSSSEVGTAISVPTDIVEQVRVSLVSELGLPDVKGMELFDNADYSMTDFSQDVTYKRALQGELSRTISSMPGVQSARVHITFAPKTLFSADQRDAKASIFIEQTPEIQLDEFQVAGIQKLTANAVERLEPDNVSIFGQNGAELTVKKDDSFGSNIDRHHQAKFLIEQRLTEKAYRLLSIASSPENIAVSVDVTLNFDQRKKMRQAFATNADGEGAIVKQKELIKSTKRDDVRSNTEQPITSSEKEVEYLHGQETEETIFSPGEISKIAVGVVLRENLSEAQISQIEEVLSAGLGINTFRGDMLAVEKIHLGKTKPLLSFASSTDSSPVSPHKRQNTVPVSVDEEPKLLKQIDSKYFNYWWILFLVVPVPVLMFLRRKSELRHRQALLIEVKEWLKEEEELHA